MRLSFWLVAVVGLTGSSLAVAAEEDAWLGELYEEVAADLQAGKPLVVHAHVPLLMTSTLLFAGAHGFGGAVRAFLEGADYREIRARTARTYGQGQGKSWRRVLSAFTNPSDRRWRRYRKVD